MYVTFEQYAELGYSLVPENEFARWEAMSGQFVRKHTFDRVTDSGITESNRRGVCEIADIYYSDANQLNRPIASFSNENYSESYGIPSRLDIPTTTERVTGVLKTYFTADQLWRGGLCPPKSWPDESGFIPDSEDSLIKAERSEAEAPLFGGESDADE